MNGVLDRREAGERHVIAVEERPGDRFFFLGQQGFEGVAGLFLFPVAPPHSPAQHLDLRVILEDVFEALPATLRATVRAQPANVDDLPLPPDLVHQVAGAAFAHEDLVGGHLDPDAGLAHLVHVDQQGVHGDDGNVAGLQLAHGSRQRVDLHRLEAAEIPVVARQVVDLVPLLLGVEFAVEPDHLDVQQLAPQFGCGLAQAAPGALQTGVGERGSQFALSSGGRARRSSRAAIARRAAVPPGTTAARHPGGSQSAQGHLLEKQSTAGFRRRRCRAAHGMGTRVGPTRGETHGSGPRASLGPDSRPMVTCPSPPRKRCRGGCGLGSTKRSQAGQRFESVPPFATAPSETHPLIVARSVGGVRSALRLIGPLSSLTRQLLGPFLADHRRPIEAPSSGSKTARCVPPAAWRDSNDGDTGQSGHRFADSDMIPKPRQVHDWLAAASSALPKPRCGEQALAWLATTGAPQVGPTKTSRDLRLPLVRR